MGTWSNRPFGNDTALDWFGELEECENATDFITNTLNEAIEGADIDSVEEEKAVAAASIVAAASNKPIKGCSADIKSWINVKGFSTTSELKKLSIKALSYVLSDRELRNLWDESEGVVAWEKQILKLVDTLNLDVESDGPERKPKKKGMPRSLGNLVDYYLESQDSKAKLKIIEKLSAIEDPNSQGKDSDYDLAINIAAKLGFVAVVEQLIMKGADPKLYSKWGSTSLTIASAYGHAATVDLLLKNGAELLVDYPTYDEQGNIDSHRMKCPAMINAMQNGTVEVIKTLESHGASLQETELNGNNLATIAEARGNKQVLEYLISRGIQPQT